MWERQRLGLIHPDNEETEFAYPYNILETSLTFDIINNNGDGSVVVVLVVRQGETKLFKFG